MTTITMAASVRLSAFGTALQNKSKKATKKPTYSHGLAAAAAIVLPLFGLNHLRRFFVHVFVRLYNAKSWLLNFLLILLFLSFGSVHI